MPDPIVLTHELRVVRTPDGAHWAPAGFTDDYWNTYLGDAADHIVLAVRVSTEAEPPPATERLDGDNIDVLGLPALRPGPALVRDLLISWHRLAELGRSDRGLLLVHPGAVGTLGLLRARLHRRPFAVQVVGDPREVAKALPGRWTIRVLLWLTTWATASACRHADAVAYVTSGELQRRYPARPGATVHSFSNVSLAPVHKGVPRDEVHRIVTVGSLAQRYKRVDLLLHALAHLRAENWELALDVVGDGRHRAELEALAAELGVDAAVTFHGQMSHDEVQAIVARGDLFALCSDTEGLPRALIEALHGGTDCVASATGGVVELLDPESSFRPGSLPSLVAALRRHLVSGRLRERAIESGLQRSEAFTAQQLAAPRAAFASAVARTATRKR